MKTVFQTKDGHLYDSSVDAFDHETDLFEAWLKEGPDLNVKTLLGGLAFDDERREYYGTLHEQMKSLLRTYFDRNIYG